MINIPEVQKYLEGVALDKSVQTVRSYDLALRKFFDFLKIENFDQIKKVTPLNCRDFQVSLTLGNVKKSSANQYVRALKVFFNYLYDTDQISKNPFDKVKFLKDPHKNLTFLSDEETTSMINACTNIEEKTIFVMMMTLGLRRSELVQLKVENISGDEVTVLGKGQKVRKVYFSPEGLDLFNQYMKVRKDQNFEYIFRSKMGCAYSTESIRLKIKKIATLAGLDPERIEKISCHTLRRSFSTNLVDRGVPLQVIQGALGHASINTTMRYANLKNEIIKNAMNNQKQILNKEN